MCRVLSHANWHPRLTGQLTSIEPRKRGLGWLGLTLTRPLGGVSAPAGQRMGKVLGMAAIQAALGLAAMSMQGKTQKMRLQSRPWMGGDANGMWVPGKEFTWDLHPEPFEWDVGQWVGTSTDATWLPRLAPFGDPRYGHYWFTPDFVPDVFNPPFGWWKRGWVVPNSDPQVGPNWNPGVIIVPQGDPVPVPEPLPYPGYRKQEAMAYDPEPVIDPVFDHAIVPGPKGPVVKNIPPTRPPRGFKPDQKYKSPALALNLLAVAGMASSSSTSGTRSSMPRTIGSVVRVISGRSLTGFSEVGTSHCA